MQDPPQREQKNHDARSRDEQVPTGLELYYNEFSKMIMEEAQRMIIDDLDPAAVAKTMQAKAESIKG